MASSNETGSHLTLLSVMRFQRGNTNCLCVQFVLCVQQVLMLSFLVTMRWISAIYSKSYCLIRWMRTHIVVENHN